MWDILDEYLEFINEFGMPAAGLTPARQSVGYKRPPGPVGKTPEEREEEEEEVRRLTKKEYTSYNPRGSGYGMMLQRWGWTQANPISKGIDTTNAHPSQKDVKKDIEVKIKTGNKKKKGSKK